MKIFLLNNNHGAAFVDLMYVLVCLKKTLDTSLKGGKKWPKPCWWIVYAVTNNVITSEVYRIFSWNKKQWKSDKIIFPMIYTLHTLQKTFSQNKSWYSKYSRNLVVFFFHFLGCPLIFLSNAARMGSFIGFSKNWKQ